MSNSQDNITSGIALTPKKTLGYTLEYQLLGTHTDTPFLEICNEVAASCHCNLISLPDLCQIGNPLQAHFHLSYARFDMMGPSDIDRSSMGKQLTILLVQNCTTDFDPSAVSSLQLDIFQLGQEQKKCYALNVAGYYLQKWDLTDITCLLYVFADKDRDASIFISDFQKKIPYFNENLTQRIYAEGKKSKKDEPTPQDFLLNIASYAQQIIGPQLKPRNSIFPQKSLLS